MVLSAKKLVVWLIPVTVFMPAAGAAQIQLDQKNPDPYGSPRPYMNAVNVPTQTSYYLTLSLTGKS